MTTRTTAAVHPATASSTRLLRSVGLGAGAGVIASMVMASYAMIASATYQHTGFFTPLYHIASTFITPNHRMMSAQSAMHGSTFVSYGGPAVLGAVIHMMVGAMYGALFGALVALTRFSGMMLIAAGCGVGRCSVRDQFVHPPGPLTRASPHGHVRLLSRQCEPDGTVHGRTAPHRNYAGGPVIRLLHPFKTTPWLADAAILAAACTAAPHAWPGAARRHQRRPLPHPRRPQHLPGETVQPSGHHDTCPDRTDPRGARVPAGERPRFVWHRDADHRLFDVAATDVYAFDVGSPSMAGPPAARGSGSGPGTPVQRSRRTTACAATGPRPRASR